MTDARVLVADSLSEAGLAVLEAADGISFEYSPKIDPETLLERIGAFDALIVRSRTQVTDAVLARGERLKVVGRAGIGVDNIDVAAATKRGVIVMNTPTGNAVTTAEHAIALLFSLARKVPAASASMKAGKWEKSKFQGAEITDKTLGVLGLGNIGKIVASRGVGLRMRVIAYDPVVSAEKAAELGVELVSFDELLRRADFVSVHVPLMDETRGMLDDAAFAKMKDGAFLVHAARGGIVDEAALERALDNGKLAGAALDVFVKEPTPADHPLVKHERVIATPHLGASTAEAQVRVAEQIARQAVAYLNEGVIEGSINVPSLPRELAERVGPYLVLARRLGWLLAGLDSVDIKELELTVAGSVAEIDPRPLTQAALAGYLEHYLDGPVNLVNAAVEAHQRGIVVKEVREDSEQKYASCLTVTVRGDKGCRTARGALSAVGEPRLIGLDNYEMDAVVEGQTLLMSNDDKPGVIGGVGTLLGSHGINVSRMQLGLDRKSGEALGVWNLDKTITSEVLEEVRKLPYIRAARSIAFK